jgi:uncharacterized protein (TIGR00725 family)
MSPAPLIAVIGSGTADAVELSLAREVGRAIGAAGCHLICGGRGGVMEAACLGHREGRVGHAAPGVTIGVLPGTDRREANPHVDVSIPTGLGIARNVIVVTGAQAVVAVGGASGTLSELALAWQLDRPIAALPASGRWSARLAGVAIDDHRAEPIFAAASPEEAIDYLLATLARNM